MYIFCFFFFHRRNEFGYPIKVVSNTNHYMYSALGVPSKISLSIKIIGTRSHQIESSIPSANLRLEEVKPLSRSRLSQLNIFDCIESRRINWSFFLVPRSPRDLFFSFFFCTFEYSFLITTARNLLFLLSIFTYLCYIHACLKHAYTFR